MPDIKLVSGDSTILAAQKLEIIYSKRLPAKWTGEFMPQTFKHVAARYADLIEKSNKYIEDHNNCQAIDNLELLILEDEIECFTKFLQTIVEYNSTLNIYNRHKGDTASLFYKIKDHLTQWDNFLGNAFLPTNVAQSNLIGLQHQKVAPIFESLKRCFNNASRALFSANLHELELWVELIHFKLDMSRALFKKVTRADTKLIKKVLERQNQIQKTHELQYKKRVIAEVNQQWQRLELEDVNLPPTPPPSPQI